MRLMKLFSRTPAVTPNTIREASDKWIRSVARTKFCSGVTPEGMAYIDTKPHGTNDNTIEFDFSGKPLKSIPEENIDTPHEASSDTFTESPKVTILLAHGYAMGTGMWAENLDALAALPRVGRIVAIDWRGMGGSERPPKRSLTDVFHRRSRTRPLSVAASATEPPRSLTPHWLHALELRSSHYLTQHVTTHTSEQSATCASSASSSALRPRHLPLFRRAATTLLRAINSQIHTPSIASSTVASPRSPLLSLMGKRVRRRHWSPARAVRFFIDPLPRLYQRLNLSSAPVVLVGHSLGGYLATCFALRHPQLVQSLVLASPVGVCAGIETLASANAPSLAARVPPNARVAAEFNELVQALGLASPSTSTTSATAELSTPSLAGHYHRDAATLAAALGPSPAPLFNNHALRVIATGWELGLTHKSVLACLLPSHTRRTASLMSARIFGEGESRQLLHEYLAALLAVPSYGESALSALLTLDYSATGLLTTLRRRREQAAERSSHSMQSRADEQTKKKKAMRGEQSPTALAGLRPHVFPSVFARAPLEPLLPQLRMPVHFMYGSHDWLFQEGVVDVVRVLRGGHADGRETDAPESVEALAATARTSKVLPGVRPPATTLTVLPDAGHHLYSNNPKAFKQSVQAAVDLYVKEDMHNFNAAAAAEYLDRVVSGTSKTSDTTIEVLDDQSESAANPQLQTAGMSLLNNPLPRGSSYRSICRYAKLLFGVDYKKFD